MYIWGALKYDHKKKNTGVNLVTNFNVLLSSPVQYFYKSQTILSFEIIVVFSTKRYLICVFLTKAAYFNGELNSKIWRSPYLAICKPLAITTTHSWLPSTEFAERCLVPSSSWVLKPKELDQGRPLCFYCIYYTLGQCNVLYRVTLYSKGKLAKGWFSNGVKTPLHWTPKEQQKKNSQCYPGGLLILSL